MSRFPRATRQLVLAAATLAVIAATLAPASAADPAAGASTAARDAAPVILEGRQLPTGSRRAAEGTPKPYPSGAMTTGDGVRDAHNGTVVVPPDARSGVAVEKITAYRWDNDKFVEVPVQVEERYPYFLANGRSDFSTYSGTDEELTYAWDVEAWNRTAGLCEAQHPEGLFPAGRTATPDPVPGLDDDDEIAFMASDAGAKAPDAAAGPKGTESTRQEVAIVDPLDPSNVRYVYLFVSNSGPSFNEGTGYVHFERDANADQWIDRNSFAGDDPEKLGSSNTGYGPNLVGTVCDTVDGSVVARSSTDRFPRDGHTVRTDKYVLTATGRWMLREMKIAKAGSEGFGPDLIDRWKGRAFQQSPDSSISVVGFEDEQVNWEANSALLGWRTGPVRAIREVWGADSGTNVTKTETYYRDAITYRYRVRVHPIPSDGLYTSWDYNRNVASTYYNVLKPEGVPIDGVNDDVGNVDSIPVLNRPAFFDAPDPTFNVPSAFGTWEQVSGKGDAGSLVYTFELKGATTASNAAVVPYYRDDACLDDGTGDDPVARPWPGEASTDSRVKAGYAALAGKPYEQLACAEKQGAYASHGVHFFATHDSDNAFVGAPEPTTEIDGQQWQFAVPTSKPTNVGQVYANNVVVPLRTVAVPQTNPAPAPKMKKAKS